MNKVSPVLESVIRLLIFVEVIFRVRVSVPLFIIRRSPRMLESFLLFFGKGESNVEIGVIMVGAISACLQDKQVIKMSKMMVFIVFMDCDADRLFPE